MLKSCFVTFLCAALLLFCLPVFAQMPDEPVQMADGLRANGKIWVVVAVVFTIIAGLFIYLINLDRKLTALEKK
ncbi:MAG TPA: CcmD family protein [Flavihumibacter sp.]|nr:CcmD family protein [Flavihumibacter sp.]